MNTVMMHIWSDVYGRPLFAVSTIHNYFMWRRTTRSFLRPFQLQSVIKRTLTMDASVSQRLSNLSKRQLLDALNAVTGNNKCTEHANSVLKEFLDALPVVRGSSRPTASGAEPSGKEGGKEEPQAAPGAFSLSKYRTRQIAMQVQYDGSAYLGFASQDLEETVENHLFNALLKLKLIEDRKTCQYSRCGRTDKGVSALGQVISVNVRSALPRDLPEEALIALRNPAGKYEITEPAVVHNANTAEQADNSGKEPPRKKSKKNASSDPPAGPKTKTITEMDYVTMLNRTLPDDIRILGWCEVTEEFSARFSASDRKYRYFFPRKTLNIEAMQQAATYLLGNHDFRNLCKMDIANVTNFRRDIYSAEIMKFEPNRYEDLYSIVHGISTSSADVRTNDLVDGPDTMYMLEIKGIAFLWHMVRCIMAVLFMVGEGLEQPEVVQRLLDIERCTGKPPYTLANEFPLVLHECGFDNLRIPRQPRHLWQLTAHYERILEGHLVSAARVRNSLELVKKSVVGKEEIAEFVEVLVEKETFSAKRAGYQNATFQQRAGLPVTAAAGAGTPVPTTKVVSNAAATSKGSIHSNKPGEVVVWKDVLERVKSDWNLQPIEKYVPHVPLMQRRQEDSYEVKVALLAGGKKDRLERHVELSATAASTGATPLFFQKMRQQGSLL